jgi:hypothetical protein
VDRCSNVNFGVADHVEDISQADASFSIYQETPRRHQASTRSTPGPLADLTFGGLGTRTWVAFNYWHQSSSQTHADGERSRPDRLRQATDRHDGRDGLSHSEN